MQVTIQLTEDVVMLLMEGLAALEAEIDDDIEGMEMADPQGIRRAQIAFMEGKQDKIIALQGVLADALSSLNKQK